MAWGRLGEREREREREREGVLLTSNHTPPPHPIGKWLGSKRNGATRMSSYGLAARSVSY